MYVHGDGYRGLAKTVLIEQRYTNHWVWDVPLGHNSGPYRLCSLFTFLSNAIEERKDYLFIFFYDEGGCSLKRSCLQFQDFRRFFEKKVLKFTKQVLSTSQLPLHWAVPFPPPTPYCMVSRPFSSFYEDLFVF